MFVLLNTVSGWRSYVPWDLDLFYSAINGLRGMIGIGFNIGIFIFLGISGIYILLKLVGSFGR